MTWTTPASVRDQLAKRWAAGTYLRMLASGAPWQPISIPIRGPKAGELADRFQEVRTWVTRWAAERHLRVEYKEVGSRTLGANLLPSRAWIDDEQSLWSVLRTDQEVRTYSALLWAACDFSQPVGDWAAANPMRVLALSEDWPALLATVRWIENSPTGSYLRQVDVPGVDTKFIERHRGDLAVLLDLQLPPERIRDDLPRSDFAGRYGFRRKPDQIRFRFLDDTRLAGFSELTVRTAELTARPPGVVSVYVIENEVSYLAFPPVPGGLAIFGGGYAVGLLQQLDWLAETDLTYWGDLDTHGFAILHRLRSHFPHVASMLMDEATLLSHRPHWTSEPSQVTHPLSALSPTEAALYQDLCDHRHGVSIRLEQERIRFSTVHTCLTT